jgi:hypothetical protein
MTDSAMLILVPRNQISVAVLQLSAIDGSDVRILPETTEVKDHHGHSFRSLNLTEYVALAVSLTGLATSLLTLTKSLVDLRKSSLENDRRKTTKTEPSQQNLYLIISERDYIEVNTRTTCEELCDRIKVYFG